MERETIELEEARTPTGRLIRELRRHWLAYAIAFAFAVTGAIVVPKLLPGASPWAGMLGGLAMGVYAALCAMPGKFLD